MLYSGITTTIFSLFEDNFYIYAKGFSGIPARITERNSELFVDPISLVAYNINLIFYPISEESNMNSW